MKNGSEPGVRRALPGDERVWRTATSSILSDEQTAGIFASDAELAAALADPHCYLFLALAGETPVGLSSAYALPDVASGGRFVYLYDIEVLPSFQRRGVGASLVAALLACCRADGVKLVWAGTNVENEPARRTFERTGAETEGEPFVEYEWELD